MSFLVWMYRFDYRLLAAGWTPSGLEIGFEAHVAF